MRFKINKYPYTKECGKLYLKSIIEFNPGVTVLVGCNGSGKSTLIKMIKSELDNNNINYISFNNVVEGGDKSIAGAANNNDYVLLSTLLSSSEGEKININLNNFANKLGNYIRSNDKQHEYYVLLDAVDSGSSIDNILNLKSLFNLVLEEVNKKNKTIYIIVSANSYEMTIDEPCFDVTKCEYRQFKTYYSYKKFILRSSKYKEDRR